MCRSPGRSNGIFITVMCQPALFGCFRQVFVLFGVVVDHAAIGKRQIGQKMMGADHAPNREIGHRPIDVRQKMQTTGSDPLALDDDIG